jgi:lantibiotic modifying enzyme
VTFAIARLRRTASPAAKRIVAQSAWNDLRQHLAARLAFALAPTLRLQQNVAKAVVRSLDVGNKQRNRRLHGEITLLETFTDFPDIRETAARLISAWIGAQHELLNRLLQDKSDLRSRFLICRQQFRVTGIRPGLSDPHDGGKTATIIRISGDQRVIYKPRSCDREQLWFEVLRWLNQNGIEVLFRIPALLPRENYHWMEFLPTTSCRSLRAVRLFYFRWGAQAALAQILAATDLHRENWLAVGSQPILVDAELIGDAEPPSRRKGRDLLDRQSLPALLQTGLLPVSSRDRAGFYRGIAPFDSTISKAAPATCWPRYRRTVQQPSRYVDDLVRGFDAAAGIFARRGAAEKFFIEIILPYSRQRDGRVLLRASSQYARLLRESFEARNMVSAGERWRRIVRECCASAVNRWVGLAEARALLRSDIPKFTIRRRTVPVRWKQFSAAIAELKDSPRLLRRRVLLGTRIRRVKRAT